MTPRIVCSLALALGLSVAPPAGAAPQESKPKPGPGAMGRFSVNDLPADRDGAALLTVAAPGRYAIRVKSASGARIELVDMIAGPGEASGAAGLRDGRIDALLDTGVYKLRVYGAKGASGKARLSAEPFTEADVKRPQLAAGQILAAELGDMSQRSYDLEIGAAGAFGVEAMGRALQDLRLWSEGGELVEASLEKATAEAKPGRPMNRIRIAGTAPPGRYVVTAYGGEALVWAEGAGPKPFMIRLDAPAPLAAGLAEGALGPFGAARFEAPADYDSFRLDLPQTAAARLSAQRGDARALAEIGKTSREPAASLTLAGDGKTPARLEVSGYEGQSYTLRAVKQESRLSYSGAGPHLVSVALAGEGGDDPPATILFARVESDGKTRVISADLPRVGAGSGYHGKFNLRGTTSLLFEATGNGVVAVDLKGIKARATIEPALGTLAPRADGRDPARYDLQAGYYLLTLTPASEAMGLVELTLAPPGLAPPLASAPLRAAVSFGVQTLEKDGSYLLLANVSPGMFTGPRIAPLPAELEKGPLPLQQGAGAELKIPVKTPKGGSIAAYDGLGAPVPLEFLDEKIENDTRLVAVKIAAPQQARALGLVFTPAPKVEEAKTQATEGDEPAAKPSGKAAAAGPVATPEKPAFFDIGRDQTKTLRFSVAEGGLYRIETLGRLQTALKVGTNFSPRIGEGENNGPGHNGLVTAYLRAGAWRAAVTAKESSGRAGLSATPVALGTTAKLVDSGTARALVAPDAGAAVPIEIGKEGLYRLDLLGVSREWRARLEDAEGWPLTAPGKLTRLTRQFEQGSYRLVVLPEDVEARMALRLTPIVSPPALQGHGPHPLPFEAKQRLQWREPADKNAPRAPDVWRFSLQGPAEAEIVIGEGMAGDLVKGQSETVGAFSDAHPFKGRLAAGDYRIEARSLAHDDRLDYTIGLTTKELQPGAPRRVDLPAKLSFAIAQDRIVDLSSFGDREIVGLLKDESGAVVERLQGGARDWGVALSRRLKAGAYVLELREAGSSPAAAEEPIEESEAEPEEGDEVAAAEGEETPAESEEAADERTEIRLDLPAEADAGALAGEKTVTGTGAQSLALAPAPAESLALVAARADREIALSIERRESGGAWRVVGTEQGLSPIAAWPASGDRSEWRAVVWPVGGGAASIAVAGRSVETRARAQGDIALERIEGLGAPVCAAHVAAPQAGLVDVAGLDAFTVGATPGALLRPAAPGAFAPQSDSLWLMARGACKPGLRVDAFQWKGREAAIDIGPGERALLPAAPTRGKAAVLLARSLFGQPGLDAGAGWTPREGAAAALLADAPAKLWNAGGPEALRATVRVVSVAALAPVQGGTLFRGVIAPLSAQPVDMAGEGPLAFDLAPDVAVFSAPEEARKFALFADSAAVSRLAHGAPAKLWLVNLSDAPAPARIARAPGRSETLTAERAIKRFYGAAGQMSLPVEAQKGDRLMVLGGAATFVSDSGAVLRGTEMTLEGRGTLVVAHKPGLVALWLERAGKTPWPTPAPQALKLPARVALAGEAMRLSLKADAPMLLEATSGAPAIVSVAQGGARDTQAFAAGVALRRYLPAGETQIDLVSPHDGALSGALDVSAQPALAVREGINDPVALAPGGRALFAFEVKREGEIGLGLRAEPDAAAARLFDMSGKTLGEGVAQFQKLAPGRYFVEARLPAEANPSVLRLAVVGLSPPPAAPPDEETEKFLELAGLKKTRTR